MISAIRYAGAGRIVIGTPGEASVSPARESTVMRFAPASESNAAKDDLPAASVMTSGVNSTEARSAAGRSWVPESVSMRLPWRSYAATFPANTSPARKEAPESIRSTRSISLRGTVDTVKFCVSSPSGFASRIAARTRFVPRSVSVRNQIHAAPVASVFAAGEETRPPPSCTVKKTFWPSTALPYASKTRAPRRTESPTATPTLSPPIFTSRYAAALSTSMGPLYPATALLALVTSTRIGSAAGYLKFPPLKNPFTRLPFAIEREAAAACALSDARTALKSIPYPADTTRFPNSSRASAVTPKSAPAVAPAGAVTTYELTISFATISTAHCAGARNPAASRAPICQEPARVPRP